MVIDFIRRKGQSYECDPVITDAFSDGLQVAHIAAYSDDTYTAHLTVERNERRCQTYERAKRFILETLDAIEGEDD